MSVSGSNSPDSLSCSAYHKDQVIRINYTIPVIMIAVLRRNTVDFRLRILPADYISK